MHNRINLAESPFKREVLETLTDSGEWVKGLSLTGKPRCNGGYIPTPTVDRRREALHDLTRAGLIDMDRRGRGSALWVRITPKGQEVWEDTK